MTSALDTPRLIALDQRIDLGQNRQRLYKGAVITEEGVVDFLRAAGVREADGAEMLTPPLWPATDDGEGLQPPVTQHAALAPPLPHGKDEL